MTLRFCRDEFQCLQIHISVLLKWFISIPAWYSWDGTLFNHFAVFIIQWLFQNIRLYCIPVDAQCICSTSCRSPFLILFMIKSQASQAKPHPIQQPSTNLFMFFYNYWTSVIRWQTFNSAPNATSTNTPTCLIRVTVKLCRTVDLQ